jgi:hypothetical protein
MQVKHLTKTKDSGPDQTCRLFDTFLSLTRNFKHIKLVCVWGGCMGFIGEQ